MNTPKDFLQNNVFGPAYQFYKNYIGKSARHTYCKNIANFIFNRSKETAVIMLFFNAVSILSSHISQIGGLKRSNRENKDYLINQEWKELGLDLVLTIVPPFLLNNFLMKKFDSGQWTTKSSREYLIDTIAPTVGATRNELYNTDHIKPFKESVSDVKNTAIKFIKDFKYTPDSIREKIPTPKIKARMSVPMVGMDDITTDFDLIRNSNFKKFYNGKAFDEISGQRNGMLILATIAYTVIASNVIMPILKNKLSNHSYLKQLEKRGETVESVKRKKRFSYNANPVLTINDNDLFKDFIPISDKQTINNNIFSNFNKTYPSKTGLKI